MSRKTEVLLVGVDQVSADNIKAALKAQHADWARPTMSVATFAEAVALLPNRPELDVIYVANKHGLSSMDMLDGCNALVRAIQKHPKAPWVCVALSCMASFADVFTVRGVEARHASLERVIVEQWDARTGAAN